MAILYISGVCEGSAAAGKLTYHLSTCYCCNNNCLRFSLFGIEPSQPIHFLDMSHFLHFLPLLQSTVPHTFISKKIDNCRVVSIKVPFRRPLCCSNQGIIVICQHIWKKGLLAALISVVGRSHVDHPPPPSLR